MSSRDCSSLEGYIKDSMFGHFTVLHIMLITRILDRGDPEIRKYIEYKINDDFDEEEQSWRDYRNSLYFVFDPFNAQIDKVVNITHVVRLVAMLLFEGHEEEIVAKFDNQDNSDTIVRFLLSYGTFSEPRYQVFMRDLLSFWRTTFGHDTDPLITYRL